MKKKYFTYLLCFLFLSSSQAIVAAHIESKDVGSVLAQKTEKVFYANGRLTLSGFDNIIAVEIFDILGKKIYANNAIRIRESVSLDLTLKANSLYIVRVHSPDTKRSFKIVAK